MFVLRVNKNGIALQSRELVTSGSVNVDTVRFVFSQDWDGLKRTAVFRAGFVSRSVLLDDTNQCAIPWEVLKFGKRQLQTGVYGEKDGALVLPTIWASLGIIQDGVSLGEDAHPPTPDLWEQELAAKADKLAYTDTGQLGLYAGDRLLSAVYVSGGGGPGSADVATDQEVDDMLDGVFGPEEK